MSLLINRKGQAIIELAIVLNIMVMLFFAMIIYGVYIYDKMVVLFAANVALDEGIGNIADSSISTDKLEEMMRDKIAKTINQAIFLDSAPQTADCKVTRKPDNTGHIKAEVSVRLSINLPFISTFLVDNEISHVSEVEFSW